MEKQEQKDYGTRTPRQQTLDEPESRAAFGRDARPGETKAEYDARMRAPTPREDDQSREGGQFGGETTE